MFPRTPSRWRPGALAGAILALAVMAGCAGAPGPARDGPAAGDSGAAVIDITMREVVFEPSAFTVPRGAKVVIRYRNPSDFIHNLLIASKEIEGRDYASPMVVKTGESGNIEAVFPNAGQLKFTCSYHLGMDGTITVR